MTKKYRYRNQEYTVKELVKLSGIGYDTMLNRLRQNWTVEDAVKTPLHSRPKEPRQIDLLASIPRAQTFNGIDLTKQDKVMIASLIDEYLRRKQRGMELLEQ